MDRLSTKGQMIDQIDLRNVPHSGFDRSNHNFLTGKLGGLIPKRLDEVYPGDRIKGTPECVTNFEPLAAPLMGTMVQKQEQFFVPYIQLWRHAWKFFTGKNGFSENMPSVTPKRIFTVWHQYLFKYIALPYPDGGLRAPYAWDTFFAILHSYFSSTDLSTNWSDFAVESHDAPLDDLRVGWDSVYPNFFDESFETEKMLDLVEPIAEIFKEFLDSNYVHDFSNALSTSNYFTSVDERKNYVRDFCYKFGKCWEEAFLYIFGPSSLLDYLGWPVVLPKQLGSGFSEDDNTPLSLFEFMSLQYMLSGGEQSSIVASAFARLLAKFSEIPLNFLPFKAYYLVWYWNYRDQLLETGILDPEEDEFLGSTITDNVIKYCTILRQRCWFKDTFTTALTNTGDGNLIVPTGSYLDGGDSADITYYDANNELINTTDRDAALNAGASMCAYKVGNITYKVPTNYLSSIETQSGTASLGGLNYISLDVFDRIKRLRSVVQKRLILGYEVDDVVFSSFMVRMTNMRMHIPEILGRGRDTVQMSTLVNNTSTDKQIAGDKTATAWCHSKSSEINYFSEDWGIYIDITTVMPIQSYAGGMQRLYLKREPFDFMWPEFATMGMDAIYNCELATVGTRLADATALQVFGYQGRYYDLKSRQDEEHGRLLTDLNFLTFSREWDEDNPPKLNYPFVHCWPRLDGFVIATKRDDVFRMDAYTGQGWERRLPVPSEIIGR